MDVTHFCLLTTLQNPKHNNNKEELLLRLQSVFEVVQNSLQVNKERVEYKLNNNAKSIEFAVGDRVFHKNEQVAKGKTSPVNFKIKEINGRKNQSVLCNRLEKFRGRGDVFIWAQRNKCPEIEVEDYTPVQYDNLDVVSEEADMNEEVVEAPVETEVSPAQPELRIIREPYSLRSQGPVEDLSW
ncbi:hypothetical protein PR048_028352, partial [Dryococelus australis]